MDRLQFLAAFGINMAKGGHIVQHRRSLMEDALVKHTRKRDSLRAQVINMLIELWRVDALPRDHVDRMSRTVELIVKSLLQHVSAIPSLDWKKIVQETCEKFEKPAASRDRSHRSRTPLRTLQSAHGETRRDSREALPRKKDQTAARSKSAAKPGERLALMNTEQRILVGNLVETPRSCAPTLVDHDDRALSPRQLFMSPPLAIERRQDRRQQIGVLFQLVLGLMGQCRMVIKMLENQLPLHKICWYVRMNQRLFKSFRCSA